MALVAYSDSEGSDTEASPLPATIKKQTKEVTGPAAFQKTKPRHIKVELPSLKQEPQDSEPERPNKRARLDGGGFNSLLPAPKRTVEKRSMGRGINLRTSSEVAFSREAPVTHTTNGEAEESIMSNDPTQGHTGADSVASAEPKIVGKATRFKPLSVQASQQTKKKRYAGPALVADQSKVTDSNRSSQALQTTTSNSITDDVRPPPEKPNRSLFSLPAVDEKPSTGSEAEQLAYEAIIDDGVEPNNSLSSQPALHQPQTTSASSNSLQSLTAGVELTSAQRRELFGRHSKTGTGHIQVAHFNMEAEYASNEALRQSGETVEHRAVKAIAPGKHSLQQLVTNARSQQDNLEDKWAEGRRERGEGGSRYGWGRG